MKRSGAVLGALAAVALMSGLSSCASIREPVPSCGAITGLALMAQSVPSATYVPCLQPPLPAGWRAGGFGASNGRTTFWLQSDRAGGRPVRVVLAAACPSPPGTPTTPRAAGALTFLWLGSISPRYTGTLTDAFAGGCIAYRFDFPRGGHIALMEELQSSIALYPRQQVVVDVRRRLGVRLDP